MIIFNYPAITSTNDYAKEHLEDHDLVVVTAAHQWLGRGRNQSHWEGDYAKNVYLSFGIRHHEPMDIETASIFQAFGCLAAQNAINSLIYKDLIKLKYPNDLVIPFLDSYQKIGGVIVEHSFFGSLCHSSVIGIGINIQQEKFTDEVSTKATSLKLQGFNIKVNEAVTSLVGQIEHYLTISPDQIRNEWLHELNLDNRTFQVIGKQGFWLFDGFEPDMRLKLVNKANAEKIIISNGDSVRYDLR
jgi:BirA family biotin operon repressor/biotin-[acetyl-CoA-carboxylase] ligase